MTGFSYQELLLVMVLGLVVLGPKRLPEIASKVGGWIGQARRMTRVMKRQLEDELNVDNLNSIQSKQLTKSPSPGDAPNASDPAYDDSDYEDKDKDKVVADHIPNDDDTFSPAHDEEQEDKPT
jgi:Tat protein translocase TatB subunit